MLILESTLQAWMPAIIGFVAALASLCATLILIRSQGNAQTKKEIRRVLETFYGPLEQALWRAAFLHQRFAKRLETQIVGFEALPYLLQNGTSSLNSAEKVLLKEIVAVHFNIENLIMSKAGLVADSQLSEKLFPELLHHILMFRLVAKGELASEIEGLECDIFPHGINQAVAKRIATLQQDLLHT